MRADISQVGDSISHGTPQLSWLPRTANSDDVIRHPVIDWYEHGCPRNSVPLADAVDDVDSLDLSKLSGQLAASSWLRIRKAGD
jgi:hypothetical protein